MSIRLGVWAPIRGSYVRRKQEPEDMVEASFEYVSRMVRRAEELGFETTIVADHWISHASGRLDMPICEAVTTTAALAPITEKIELMLAYRPAARHPAIMAKMGATIDNISGGRFALNVVSGFYEEEHRRYGIPFPDHDRRHQLSLEAVEILRGLWTQPSFSYTGEAYTVTDAIVAPAPVSKPHPTIYFGGESEAGKETAARIADVYLMVGRPVEEAAALIEDVRERAARHGRTLRYGISGFVICEETEALANARLEALLEETGGTAQTTGGVDPLAQHIRMARESRGVGSNGGIASGLVGSPEQVIERMREFEAVGIETFLLQFDPLIEGMERFAEQVGPLLRESAATSG